MRIRLLRKKKGMSQQMLANRLGITQAALSGWETGKYQPDIASLERLAEIFGVSIDCILGKEEASPPKGIKVPILGRVIAGVPVEAVEDVLGYVEISPQMASQGEFFALEVKGDSMEPKFSQGDVVIVRKQPDADTGDIVIAVVNEQDATIKKLKKRPDGVLLVPLNPKYDIMYFNNEEVLSRPVQILGKAVELRAKL